MTSAGVVVGMVMGAFVLAVMLLGVLAHVEGRNR